MTTDSPVCVECKGNCPTPHRCRDMQARFDALERERDGWKEATEMANSAIEHYQAERDKADAYAVTVAQALSNMVEHYVMLVNSGDAGNWNPEAEPVVVHARAALAANPSTTGRAGESDGHSTNAEGAEVSSPPPVTHPTDRGTDCPLPREHRELVNALRSGRQADPDGITVTVSREACERGAALIESLTARLAGAFDQITRLQSTPSQDLVSVPRKDILALATKDFVQDGEAWNARARLLQAAKRKQSEIGSDSMQGDDVQRNRDGWMHAEQALNKAEWLLRRVDEAVKVIPENIEGHLEPLSEVIVDVRKFLAINPSEPR